MWILMLVLLLLGAQLNLTAIVPLQAGDTPPPWWVGGRLLWPFAVETRTLLPAGETLNALTPILGIASAVCFVLAAAALGCAYAAPYLGRLDDLGRDGTAEVVAMQELLQNAAAPTRLLVASLRSWDKVVELAWEGCDTFTFGPGVAEGLVDDPDTEEAAEAFAEAAREMGAENVD